MTSATIAQPQRKMFGLKTWLLAAGVLLLIGLAAGGYAWYSNANSNLPGAVDLAEFEEISGFRPKMIVVTAGGGIVDFRFKVIDPLIVGQIMASTQTAPRLLVADTGQVLDVGAHHLNSYTEGSTYFMFYPNSGSSVKSGTELWVVVEDVRYGPIVVE